MPIPELANAAQAIQNIDDARRVSGSIETAVIDLQQRTADVEEGRGYLAGSIRRIYSSHSVGEHLTMIYVGDTAATFTLPDLANEVKFTTFQCFIKNATTQTVTVESKGGQLIDDSATQTLGYMDTIKVRADLTQPDDLRWWIE